MRNSGFYGAWANPVFAMVTPHVSRLTSHLSPFMIFSDFFDLIKQYGNIKKCIHCQAYQDALSRVSRDTPKYFDEEWNSRAIVVKTQAYGFLNCEVCPPLEILEEYLETEGRRELLRPKKKHKLPDDFSVNLFLKKIAEEKRE